MHSWATTDGKSGKAPKSIGGCMETPTLHLWNATMVQSKATQWFVLCCVTLNLPSHSRPHKVALCGLINPTYVLRCPCTPLRGAGATQNLHKCAPQFSFSVTIYISTCAVCTPFILLSTTMPDLLKSLSYLQSPVPELWPYFCLIKGSPSLKSKRKLCLLRISNQNAFNHVCSSCEVPWHTIVYGAMLNNVHKTKIFRNPVFCGVTT